MDTAYELLDNEVDGMTSGIHIGDQKQIIVYSEEALPLIRPAR